MTEMFMNLPQDNTKTNSYYTTAGQRSDRNRKCEGRDVPFKTYVSGVVHKGSTDWLKYTTTTISGI